VKWESTALIAARIDAVRRFCIEQIAHDNPIPGRGLTDRSRCALGVLNILDGIIDDQLRKDE
jgi:hypothetical protein